MADLSDAAPGSIFQGADDTTQAVLDFDKLVQEATTAFFQQMQVRHEMGEAKYGPVKFMQVNTLVEAQEELIDIANYALYTFIKLSILNAQIQAMTDDQPEMLGPNSFMKAGK